VIFNRRGEQLPHGPHAEIFFRGGGDLIIFRHQTISNVRAFAVRPSRKRFQTLAPSLCPAGSSRGKTLRIYFRQEGGHQKCRVLAPGPLGSLTRMAAEFGETFFGRRAGHDQRVTGAGCGDPSTGGPPEGGRAPPATLAWRHRGQWAVMKKSDMLFPPRSRKKRSGEIC
jgi:hypothetical protein